MGKVQQRVRGGRGEEGGVKDDVLTRKGFFFFSIPISESDREVVLHLFSVFCSFNFALF